MNQITRWRENFLQLVCISTILCSLSACNKKTETIKPRLNDLTESIYASVTIQPEDIYTVYSSTSGILEVLTIEEGDAVKSGQMLARIKTIVPSLNIENANLSLELAKEKYLGQSNTLASIKNEMDQLAQQIQLDSINYIRQMNLWKQNIGSKAELENRKLKLEIGQKQRAGLFKKYHQAEVELENLYKKSQTSLKKAKTDLNDYTIQSKIDGKVYSLFKNEGERINPQEPLASIGKEEEYIIEMRIDEVDIARVKNDQKVLITLDAYNGQVFEGHITRIYPQKDKQTQTFKIEGKFDQIPEVLYAGLSGEANIIFAQRKNVLTIPLEYLIDQSRVKTIDGEVNVQTGIKTMDRIEIISGLDTATQILKP